MIDFKAIEENIIVVQDPVDLDKITECKCVYIENDEGLIFLYLQSTTPEDNVHWEPKINGYIYTLVEVSMLGNQNCYIKYEN